MHRDYSFGSRCNGRFHCGGIHGVAVVNVNNDELSAGLQHRFCRGNKGERWNNDLVA